MLLKDLVELWWNRNHPGARDMVGSDTQPVKVEGSPPGFMYLEDARIQLPYRMVPIPSLSEQALRGWLSLNTDP
jgi:hypothetical protein